MRKLRRLALTLLVCALALVAGCGEGDEPEGGAADNTTEQAPADTGGGARTTSEVTMSELKFEPSDVTVKQGATLTVVNAGTIGHDLKVRRGSEQLGGTEVLDAGASAKLQVDFDPGEYEMFCSVPGHEEGGMKGTFTVQ